MGKGPALLLLVLAQDGNASKFAAHLARLLLLSSSQYMPGFSAIWAANPEFLVNVMNDLYEDHNSLIGRILDMIDDLCVFDSFVKMSKPLLAVMLHLCAFFRRGHNFKIALSMMYETDHTILDLFFKIFS